MNKKKYQTPQMKSVEVDARQIICASPMTENENEKYEIGSTEDWF